MGRHRDTGDHPPVDAFRSRMRQVARLDEEALAAVGRLPREPRAVAARREIVREGQRPDRLHVLVTGWAARVHLLRDGRRQIVAVLLPGDFCDLGALYVEHADASVVSLTPCVVASLGASELRDLAETSPAVARGLGRCAAVEIAMLAQRNACLGRRSAREHLAHFLCELMARLEVVSATKAGSFVLPITQEEIADVLGLTAVHVNRVLQSLRGEGLIDQRGHAVMARDWGALRRLADFRPDYLHLPATATDAAERRAAG